MAGSDTLHPDRRSWIMALVFTAAALLTRLALDPYLGDQFPFFTFFVSVAATAYLARLSSTLLAIALGFACGNWFFVQPRHSFAMSEIGYVAVYFATVGALAGMSLLTSRERSRALVSARELAVQGSRLQREIREREEAQRALRIQSEVAAQLIVAPGSNEVFELITERIRDIAGDAIVAGSEFEPHGSVLIVRSVRCSDSDREVLRKLFGRDPEGLQLRLSDEIRKQWKAGGMDRLAGGVHELVFAMLPASACEQAERELGATGVFAMACSYEQDILGTVAVISREAHPLEKRKLIEALIAQSGLALKRSRADSAVRAANEKLIEADRGKSEFLAVLSHELRNPLAPINNALYILEHAAPGGDQSRRAQAVIGRQVGQLCRLVDDLLDATRITRNKVQLQRQLLELNDLVRQTVEDYLPQFESAEVALELTAAPGPVLVDGDRNRLAQIVGNLLANAAKFTGPGGRASVTVSSDETAGNAIVRIVDTGIGMTPEVQARLFQPFMQADVTLDRSKGGLGLGLSLVKGMVALHRGDITVRSDGPGKGTDVVVTLPLHPGSGDQPARAPVPAPMPGRRVLIIEDNVDAADSLKEVLELEHHEVSVAHDGPKGISMAKEMRPEVVLCDIGLPGMDGYGVARAFRADPELRGIYLVALSGYALPEDLQRSKEAGFDLHLAKPPAIDRVEQVLREAGRPAHTT